MIQADSMNFSARLMQKKKNDPTASKDTFYAHFRICLALKGEAVWEIEDRTYTVRPGDIIFLNIGQKRRFTAFGEEGFQLAIFSFERNAFAEWHHFAFFLEQVKNGRNVFQNSPLASLLREVFEEYEGGKPFRHELISAKLTEFFIKAEREEGFSLPLKKADLELLKRMNEIDEGIVRGLRMQDIAREAGMSESGFSRRFSAVNGISFKQYSIEKKLERAIRLLNTTDLKTADVAMECGFDSVSGFYDAFKKKTGATPGKFLTSV
ncbi:MAG: helix-turn-helix transcriptional regulator [Clostridia bacterium]|nr:helix-turn-helix transcriptional regulator [Clostridia bacterium]